MSSENSMTTSSSQKDVERATEIAELGMKERQEGNGEEAMLDPHEIDDRFPLLDLVLDGGVCGTIPTTIVDLSGPEAVVLREGAGSLDVFERPPVSSRQMF